MTQEMIDVAKLPRHVAIIMDGNGRWAKKKLWNRVRGHSEGAESVDVITQYARKIGIEYLTLYAFSTENWNRPQDEVDALMKLLRDFLTKKRETMLKNNIRLNYIGQIDRLPENVRSLLTSIADETEKNGYRMTLTLALSYGARDEMVRGFKSIAKKIASGEIAPEQIDDAMISTSLDTAIKDIPDPDLIIRTSGEQRISNFLLWQAAYAEFYFTDILWPDFREAQFLDAMKIYAQRERRFGKTGDQLSV